MAESLAKVQNYINRRLHERLKIEYPMDQIEFLKMKKSVVWIQQDKPPEGMPEEAREILYRNARKEGEFGPPLFDESRRAHHWR